MTPDELREAADRLAVISPNLKPDSLDATVIRATRRLADVIEYVEARDDVANYTVNDRLLRVARGETNEREER
ncbi:MAG: hypothetical protein ACTH31_00775 [Pseudoclavibacter sp.]